MGITSSQPVQDPSQATDLSKSNLPPLRHDTHGTPVSTSEIVSETVIVHETKSTQIAHPLLSTPRATPLDVMVKRKAKAAPATPAHEYDMDDPGTQLRQEWLQSQKQGTEELNSGYARHDTDIEYDGKAQANMATPVPAKSEKKKRKRKASPPGEDGDIAIPVPAESEKKKRKRKASDADGDTNQPSNTKKPRKSHKSGTEETEAMTTGTPKDITLDASAISGKEVEDMLVRRASEITPKKAKKEKKGKKRQLVEVSEEREEGGEPMETHSSAKPKRKNRKSMAVEQEDVDSTQQTQADPDSKSGAFDNGEIRLIDDTVDDFKCTHGLSDVEFNHKVQTLAPNSADIAEVFLMLSENLPNRNRKAIIKNVKRRFHNYQTGPWDEDQDELLRDAFAETPNKWIAISNKVGRRAEDCRDRWRNHGQYGTDRNKDIWNEEEEQQLQNAVATCVQRMQEAGHLPNDIDVADLSDDALQWGVVSQIMDGRRSRLQCAYKWRKLKARWERETEEKLGLRTKKVRKSGEKSRKSSSSGKTSKKSRSSGRASKKSSTKSSKRSRRSEDFVTEEMDNEVDQWHTAATNGSEMQGAAASLLMELHEADDAGEVEEADEAAEAEAAAAMPSIPQQDEQDDEAEDVVQDESSSADDDIEEVLDEQLCQSRWEAFMPGDRYAMLHEWKDVLDHCNIQDNDGLNEAVEERYGNVEWNQHDRQWNFLKYVPDYDPDESLAPQVQAAMWEMEKRHSWNVFNVTCKGPRNYHFAAPDASDMPITPRRTSENDSGTSDHDWRHRRTEETEGEAPLNGQTDATLSAAHQEQILEEPSPDQQDVSAVQDDDEQSVAEPLEEIEEEEQDIWEPGPTPEKGHRLNKPSTLSRVPSASRSTSFLPESPTLTRKNAKTQPRFLPQRVLDYGEEDPVEEVSQEVSGESLPNPWTDSLAEAGYETRDHHASSEDEEFDQEVEDEFDDDPDERSGTVHINGIIDGSEEHNKAEYHGNNNRSHVVDNASNDLYAPKNNPTSNGAAVKEANENVDSDSDSESDGREAEEEDSNIEDGDDNDLPTRRHETTPDAEMSYSQLMQEEELGSPSTHRRLADHPSSSRDAPLVISSDESNESDEDMSDSTVEDEIGTEARSADMPDLRSAASRYIVAPWEEEVEGDASDESILASGRALVNAAVGRGGEAGADDEMMVPASDDENASKGRGYTSSYRAGQAEEDDDDLGSIDGY